MVNSPVFGPGVQGKHHPPSCFWQPVGQESVPPQSRSRSKFLFPASPAPTQRPASAIFVLVPQCGLHSGSPPPHSPIIIHMLAPPPTSPRTAGCIAVTSIPNPFVYPLVGYCLPRFPELVGSSYFRGNYMIIHRGFKHEITNQGHRPVGEDLHLPRITGFEPNFKKKGHL